MPRLDTSSPPAGDLAPLVDEDPSYQLIVVGSSAGGIEALATLVASLPADFPAPLVLAQHLDPTRPSHLGEILARHAPLPVVTVADHAPLRPGTVYVVPANRHVAITAHDMTVLPDGPGRPKPSIDLLLTSAAAVYGPQLIAVILTGTGSDGTAGADAVHAAGGTVMIQNPQTAAFASMPASVAPAAIDIVADLSQIGPLLGDLLAGRPVPPRPEAAPALAALLTGVQAQTGVDFAAYKPATILRRLQRRIADTATGDLAGYQAYLDTHPAEYAQLVRTCLIKVTEFLRDPELFARLRAEILPRLTAASAARDHELRLWSAGCATGEEAYSLAILLCELLGEELPRFDVRIFATDLDAEAIAFARHGVYPAASIKGVPADLLARYFTAGPDGYIINKAVRSLVVFGEHDLGQRAPFPRIDLVLCRNVLIYFSADLQQRALQLFAFALREGGYLVLGRTETVHLVAEFFVPVPGAPKVYQRLGGRRPVPAVPMAQRVPPRLPLDGRALGLGHELFQLQQEMQQARVGRDTLLLQLPIGVIVVDRHYDIQEINSAARRLLSIHSAAIGEDFVHLAGHLSSPALRGAIDATFLTATPTPLAEVMVPHVLTGAATYLQITCYPQGGESGGGRVDAVLILVTDVTTAAEARRADTQAHAAQQSRESAQALALAEQQAANQQLARRVAELEQVAATQKAALQEGERVVAGHVRQMEHLVATNRALLAANETLTLANVELRAARDTYLLTTEEAQAAIEEAETLNEEMQATNEELETLNEELQATIEELHTANSDLGARGDELQQLALAQDRGREQSEHARAQLATILASLADAVLVVTADGTPLVTNAAYAALFDGGAVRLADDRGQPIPPDATPQARARRGETFALTFTLTRANGERRWCEALGRPAGDANLLPGGIVVIRDITDRSLRHLQDEFLALASHELRTPLTVISATFQQLARWHAPRPESERPRRQIALALTQVVRLTRLIDDLLDVSRLQTGKFRVHLVPLRLDTLLAETVEVGQRLSTQQTLILESEPGPVLVAGDAGRLQQVVLNLVTNALTYAAGPAPIVVGLRRVGAHAEITVADQGSGIAPEALPHVFGRFYQVASGPEGQAGLGLGLYIAQQIVTTHGGTIGVQSTVGAGTTFTIQLPIVPEDAPN
ncbi:MAG TPA: CheR family methyltransferase [Chloroflexia bacterium]|nr:CheR family methyltransferase [Chloroflexia bacterium]